MQSPEIPRRRPPSWEGLLAGLAAGLVGFVIDGFPLSLWPGVHLVFGSAITLVAAVRYGPVIGLVAGLVAGLRTWWLWDQPLPWSALLLALEGAWVGYLYRRRPEWRPLYLTLSYWVLVGSGLNLFAQHLLFGLPWTISAALGLRAIVNGFFCALMAEVLLMIVADVERRHWSGRPFRLGLSALIGLVLMLGISLPATVAVVGFSRQTRDQLIEEAQVSTVKRANSLRHAMSARLNTFRRAVGFTAGVIESEGIGLDQAERLNRLLENARRANPELAGMYVADARAVTVAFSPSRDAEGHSLIGRDYSDRRYFQELLQTRKIVFSGVYQARGGMTTPTAAIAVPLLEPDGRLRGFVLGWFHLENFHETASAVLGPSAGDQGVITDAEGLLVADSTRRARDYLRVQSVAGEPMFIAALRADTGSELLESGGAGRARTAAAATLTERSWVAWATVPESGWKVMVGSSMQAVDHKIAVLYMRTALGLASLVLVGAVVAQFVGRRIARPLVVLESNARRLAAGDLSARPEPSYILTREVQSLTETFGEMVTRLDQSWSEQRGLTERAENTAREAQAYARHLGALHELGRELASTFDLTHLSRAARGYLQDELEASTVVLSLYQPAVDRLIPFYRWTQEAGEDARPAAPSEAREEAESRCRKQKVPVLVAPASLCLPLLVQDRLIGSVYVEAPEGSLSLGDLKRLQPAANQIAMSVSNARLFEQVLRAKAEWETTFDEMSDGVFLFDERRRLVRVNRSGAAMEGLSPQALVGRSCCEVLTGADAGRCMVADVLSTGIPVSREVSSRERLLFVTIEPVRSTGHITGALCVIRDLTDLRRAQEETREQRQLSSQLLEFAQEVVCTVDREGRTAWFNRRLCEGTGYSSAELEEASLLEFVHPDDRERVLRRFEHALAGEAESVEARFIRKDGEVRWFTASYAPINDEGLTVGALAVMRDVTEERRSAERLQQANKMAAVGQLAAGVAHDFNNVLTAILGRAQLLRRRLHDPEQQAGLEVIEKAALDGAATVRRLQNFAERTPEHELEAVLLDELVKDVVQLMRTRWRDDAQARGIVYDLELDLQAPERVLASPSEMREVLTNLMINALDAMPDGGRLTLQSRTEGGRVRLRVADTGLGMAPDVRQRIFEPFYTTKGPSGMGLGLAVSYGIVERHHGSIEVESELGRGTVFTLSLPSTSRPPRSHTPPAAAPAPPVRALVIDDEDAVRATLAEVLIALGHDVVSVPSGREGLQRLEGCPFDVVFTDLSMPGMDGWSVARSVRGLRPATKVFLVTGYGASVELTEETAALVDGVISKPFAIDQIDSVIRHLAVA